jgi:predicted nucleic acid-binding protein
VAEPFAPFPLVVDTSAWVRQREPAIRPRWIATARAELLASCPVVALELLAAARDDSEYTTLAAHFEALLQAPVTASACRAALSASRDLRGSRRLPAADYLIAAAAAERGFGVLHQDRHFDTLAQVLGFESVRLID